MDALPKLELILSNSCGAGPLAVWGTVGSANLTVFRTVVAMFADLSADLSADLIAGFSISRAICLAPVPDSRAKLYDADLIEVIEQRSNTVHG